MLSIKNILKGFILSLIIIVLRPYVYSQNILQNGGFEEGQGDWSTYFDSGLGYDGSLSMSSANAHSGDKAAKISVTQVPANPSGVESTVKKQSFSY